MAEDGAPMEVRSTPKPANAGSSSSSDEDATRGFPNLPPADHVADMVDSRAPVGAPPSQWPRDATPPRGQLPDAPVDSPVPRLLTFRRSRGKLENNAGAAAPTSSPADMLTEPIPPPLRAKDSAASPRNGESGSGRLATYSPLHVSVSRKRSISAPDPATPPTAASTVELGLDLSGDLTSDLPAARPRVQEEKYKRMDLRAAVRSGVIENLEKAMEHTSVRQELMAQNAQGGAGLLMLAAVVGKVQMFKHLACVIKAKVGTTLLAKQLRYEDDEKRPLLFYGLKSVPMFFAVRERLLHTIGMAGFGDQLRHLDAKGRNVLMHACGDEDVFELVWDNLHENGNLEKQKEALDNEGKGWLLHAAEAGNTAVFRHLAVAQDSCALFNAVDAKGWSGFMYAARQKTRIPLFLRKLFGLYSSTRSEGLEKQLTSWALLKHAAIGGYECFDMVCRFMRHKKCTGWPVKDELYADLLAWAAHGGDIRVVNAVAAGLKANTFPDGNPESPWYHALSDPHEDRLARAVDWCAAQGCAETPHESLFLSAIRSGVPEMIRVIAEGVCVHAPPGQKQWELLCGVHEEEGQELSGNPLVVAASISVKAFQETFTALDAVAYADASGRLRDQLKIILAPETQKTPLYSAVCSDDTTLFDEVLRQIKAHMEEHEYGGLNSSTILGQVVHAMRKIDDEETKDTKWISANMLPRVLEAVKIADADNESIVFDVTQLDAFVGIAVKRGAFDHVRVLCRSGCDLVQHFPALLAKIGVKELDTSECLILAITNSSNPFVECGIASQAIYSATISRNKNKAALGRLQQKISELALELVEHLPHTVSGVGVELARGDPNLKQFQDIRTIKPAELLGYVVVEWILEGSGESTGKSCGGGNPLLQAVRSGPQAMELLSEPLVLDYLGLKFNRTLPSWNSQEPFERNINQAFYSYAPVEGETKSNPSRPLGFFQNLLLWLQGWKMEESSFPHYTVLPGLQFTLAGVMGKPVAYYVVPAVRMAFVVMSYLGMVSLYLSSVSLKSGDIPLNEWFFYVYMAAVAWREALEFLHARTSEPGSMPGVGASIERYFYDKWNFLDVTTILFIAVAFTFRMIEWKTGELKHLFFAQIFLAVSAPLLFSRVLFLSQIGSALGPMTQVIFNMMTQMGQFSVVILLVMLGFASCFNALYGEGSFLVERNFNSCDVNDHPVVEAFGTTGGALLTMFSSMLGEFSFDAFYSTYEDDDGNYCGGVSYADAGVALMVLYLIVMAVVLLNLLIAVLSTAHAEVDQNAEKEFHLARAKIILQSGDDVVNGVLPPPFNLIKPTLGIVWPACGNQTLDRWWEIITGVLHRAIFAFFVGLGAVTLSTFLWVVSLPMVAWKISQWLSKHDMLWFSGKTGPELPAPLERQDPSLSTIEHSDDADLKDSIERIFFRDAGEERGRVPAKEYFWLVGSMLNIAVGLAMATVLCCLVYPVLSVVLWCRGCVGLYIYGRRQRGKATPWKRRQINLGEEGEWDVARRHAIRRNTRYMTGHSSEDEFNVDALLKTTTGMTMEDLRFNMTNMKSVRRQRALGASMDALLKQHPSDDHATLSVQTLSQTFDFRDGAAMESVIDVKDT